MTPSRGRSPITLTLAIFATFLTCISAQSTSTSASSSAPKPSSSSGPKVYTVAVGPNGEHTFQPNVTMANIGDIVQFQFYPSNHSVVRGEYTGSTACGPSGCNPCVPYETIHPNEKDKGFSSKNILTDKFDETNPTLVYNVTIKNRDPIWYYCTALQSCAPNGMVGVINPPETATIARQFEAATKAKFQLVPGQGWPIEGGNVVGAESNTTSSTAKPSSSGVTHDHRLSGGAIAGIAVGGAIVIFLAAGLCYFVGRSNTYREVIKNRSEGNTSQVGDNVGPWTASNQTPQMGQGWQQDHRFSGQTAYSQFSPPIDQSATFVGYNRNTGAPEFALEVPTPGDNKSKPPSGHPAFREHGQQETTYELPGETPTTAELGPSQPSQLSQPKS